MPLTLDDLLEARVMTYPAFWPKAGRPHLKTLPRGTVRGVMRAGLSVLAVELDTGELVFRQSNQVYAMATIN